jgi:hypothetical protein
LVQFGAFFHFDFANACPHPPCVLLLSTRLLTRTWITSIVSWSSM